MRIDGQVVLLTGASSGIGQALAGELAQRGARLALTARSIAPHPTHFTLAGDLTNPLFRQQLIAATLARYGRIDILINNAGVGLYQPSWQADDQAVRQMFELNLFAALHLTQLAVPGMRERRHGMIVNIGSIASKVTLPWFTLYSATKHALASFTDGLRMENAAAGLHAMLVCPGYVKTRFQQNVLIGRPPDELASGRRFATTAPTLARAIADGIARNRRQVLHPASGWALIAAWRTLPRLVEAIFEKLQRDHQ
ncbi:MAG: SDR family NAD(P)-dependent oxidoreductase [Acidobacteriaceae bacterium]|jgi:short-subunit dehydrogenase|nr:SDR family NAD(P)-dependent oxidoreductase [Acidobacteriaceae bacterium]